MSRIHGTRRIHEVTGGHEEDPIRVQEEPRGHHRTREDTPLRRFATVRPRVQIPGPRPVFEFEPDSAPDNDVTTPLYYPENPEIPASKYRGQYLWEDQK